MNINPTKAFAPLADRKSAAAGRPPSWEEHIRQSAGRDTGVVLRHLFGKPELAASLEKLQSSGALDFGAGGGRDTRVLHAKGWPVIAQDMSDQTVSELQEFVRESDQVEVHIGSVEDIDEDRRFGLFTANNVMPFIEEPTTVLRAASERLVPGGVLSINFFGDKHGWNGQFRGSNVHGARFTSAEQVLADVRAAGFVDVSVSEIVDERTIVNGKPMPWHDILVVARAPSGVDDKRAGPRSEEPQPWLCPGCVIL